MPPRHPGDSATTIASIHDVARTASVSLATVSRVLNGTGPVRDETRKKVLEAVERLGYVPHGGARSLITRQTRTIGVILPDIYGEFFSELIRGADLAARDAGYHLLVSGAHSNEQDTREVLRALHGRVDALIVMAPVASDTVDRALPGGVPVVLLNHASRDTRHRTIRIDNRGGARAMTEHLLDLGHRRIALVLGPPDNEDAIERRRGYEEALSARRVAVDPALLLPGDFTDGAGERAGLLVADLDPRPTAVFATNDAMAIGCLAGLRGRGLRVPEDVALAGFDDIPFSRYVSPPLTTVQVAISELGSRAAARVVQALAGTAPTRRHELLPTTLVVRESCGAHRPIQPRVPPRAPRATAGRKRRRQ
jgi:LacI family transcriptional regulator